MKKQGTVVILIPNKQIMIRGGTMKFHSIKTQLTVIFMTLIVFLIICVSILAELISSNAFINKSVLSANRELRMMNEKVELFAEDIEAVSLYLIQVQNSESFNEPYENFGYTSGILSFLQDFVFTHPTVESISFYDQQGTVLFSDTKSNVAEIPDQKVPYIEKFKEEDQNTKWIGFHNFDDQEGDDSKDWGCSFLRKVYSYTGDFLGIFELNISEKSIQSIYDIALADNYSFYILDESGTVVSAKDKDMLHLSMDKLKEIYPQEQISHLFHSPSNYLYTTYDNQKLGWTLVSTLPLKILLRETNKLVLSIFGIGFVAIILAFMLLNRLTRFITHPLIDLTETVEKIAEGNYGIRADENTPNEIGRLAGRVNMMSKNTMNLLNTIEKESALKRQFELSYIQLQMTPHFLYNTLESICGMIAVDEKKKAIRMIQDLSSFYRKILTRGTPIVTIRQELEIIKCYLDILRQRYCESYSYEIHVAPGAEEYYIPKLTLQPFVENALIHGVLAAGRPGEIKISVSYIGGKLRLDIVDNGRGMEGDVLEKLRILLQKREFVPEKEFGFGIINTFCRLSLFLNEPDIQILIDSAPGEGTSVSLILPAKHGENLRKEIEGYYV